MISKVLWLLGVLIAPLIGSIVYLLTRPMTDLDLERMAEFEAIDRQQRVAAGASVADEIEKLAVLRDKGLISSEDFERQRTSLLR